MLALACGVGTWFLNIAFVLDILYDGDGDVKSVIPSEY